MYTKEEVFNIRHNDYKITPMDKKIYEELELTDTEKKLLQRKHKELCKGYWSVPK